MVFLGIDPGFTGALAWYLPHNGNLIVSDMPTTVIGKKSAIDTALLAKKIAAKSEQTKLCVLEKVNAHPRQDAGSTGRFMDGYGQIKMALSMAGVPYVQIQASEWRRGVGLPSNQGQKSKRPSRLKASELFSDWKSYWHLAKHDGRAEAALMAWYAKELYDLKAEKVLLG